MLYRFHISVKDIFGFRVAEKLNLAKKRVEFDLSEALEIVEGRLKKPDNLLSSSTGKDFLQMVAVIDLSGDNG